MSERPRKCLIVLLGAIGDVTQGLTLATRLKDAWPDLSLSWAVEPPSRDLVAHHRAIDRVFVFERSKGLSAFRQFLRQLRGVEFDLVLDLQRHLKSGIVSWSTRAPRRIGFHRRNSKEGNWLLNTERIPYQEKFSPKISQYHVFGDYLELPRPAEFDFGLQIGSAEHERVERLIAEAVGELEVEVPPPDQRVALIIGANWASKRWGAEQFSELVQVLFERWGLRSLLVGGKAERDMAHGIALQCQHVPVIDLVGKTTLIDLAALFSRVKLAIGGDTGPTHLASTARIPVIALFGATHPKRSSPYGNESLSLQSPIGCSPCYRRTCPGLDNLCMVDIPTEAVIHRVDSIMARLWDR